MTPDPHKPLRDDVRVLGELLGETLKTQAGEHLLATVERVRALSKGARASRDDDFHVLADELASISLDDALPLARAFTHFLHLANIAEQHHRIRRRRAYRRDPQAQPQRGSCEDGFARLLAAGVTPDQLHEAVCALQIELVLTAHPTEVARRTLVQKYNRIAASLAMRDRPDLTPHEQEELLAALRREIVTAWATSDVRQQRPTPLDEVRSGLDRVRAEPLGSAAALPAQRSTGRCARARGAGCRSTRRRCGSARGLAATATATRTSRRR